MKKLNKIFACVLCVVICITCMCGISVKAKSDYWFDVTDTEVKANTPIEINSINEGLRQKINDTVQNYVGCTVTFKVKYSGLSTSDIFISNVNRAVLVGNDYFKAYGTINGNYITFSWDEFIPKHNMWGLISDIKFACSNDVIITDIYVTVPEQPQLGELSAGAGCYETTIALQ